MMRDRSVEYLRLFSLFLIPIVIIASIFMLFLPYEEPLKLIHKTLNKDIHGASFNVRDVSRYSLPKTFLVGYQPNPRQHGDYKEHLFFKKLDTYDRVKFTIQSTEPVVFLLKTGEEEPSFSYEYLKSGIVFNGTITEYDYEYEADSDHYIVFHFTTAHPALGYKTRPEYKVNVTLNGQFTEYQNYRIKKWFN